ncbi:N-acetylglucosaminyl-phosphatidylinositol de-N-acetylase, putative [Talaromyces stipitatus ATCC 10500]|uniref:N-acetylglucosaminylphosphatidylinositol deacetylase n=1 Tax=Talaromyces stipitatus (strain ATCC 10500 / CBS 375.48 / QM 6759 / NRRL 1006) TaxID=441959 RepID=B8M6B7_TALSN|nr:N-acetylglucosaminyl-phosphatidylinositol de-N-acetylase, putative [Talaromyces stipitatus ATCC 10500]EED19292.1 N-acetylglucosaminyl-phosphatidylinositol de-N-acetylase, putative [Talaromyces stipitatus ATCC 10500]
MMAAYSLVRVYYRVGGGNMSTDMSSSCHLVILENSETNRLETKASCDQYSIPDKKCLILENKDLQAHRPWDEQLIQRILERHVTKWNVDLIITFDAYGISSHDENHVALSNSVQRFSNLHDHHNPVAYALQTKSMFRAYLSLLDLVPTSVPFTFRILQAMFLSVPEGYQTSLDGKIAIPPPKDGDVYGDKALIVTSWSRHVKAQEALRKHASESSWNRVLYSSLSRYMWFNDLRRM